MSRLNGIEQFMALCPTQPAPRTIRCNSRYSSSQFGITGRAIAGRSLQTGSPTSWLLILPGLAASPASRMKAPLRAPKN